MYIAQIYDVYGLIIIELTIRVTRWWKYSNIHNVWKSLAPPMMIFSMKTIFKFLGCPRIVRDVCQMSGFSSGSEVTYTDIRLKIRIYVSAVRSSLKGTLVWLVISARWNRATMYVHIEQSLANIVSSAVMAKHQVQRGSLPFGIFRNLIYIPLGIP